MELNCNMEVDDMPLSLITKFCDSRLKELSAKSQNETSDQNIGQSSLFSNIISQSSSISSSYKPKRREHCSISSAVCDSEQTTINCSDFAEPSAQQLHITRKIPLSKHIKPYKVAEFLTQESISNNNEDNVGYSFDSDVNSENSYVKERLQSYLPTLKRHVENGEWAHLDEFPSLASLMMGTGDLDKNSQNGPDYIHNTYQYSCKWDSEQAFLIASTPQIMVFYGVVSKPNSVNVQRLRKLFAHVGAAPLPLQNMTELKKKLYLQDGTGRIELNDLLNKLDYKVVVSGIPVAIIGKVSSTILIVEDVIYATPCAPEWPFPTDDGIEMIFVSGLYLGSDESNNLALDLLQDYLLGLTGSAFEQAEIMSSRARLFLVGNLISKSMKSKPSSLEHVTSVCGNHMEKLDNFLAPLVRLMEVFLVPGENDMTFSTVLPQPPVHSKLLPQSRPFCTLKRLPNPAKIQVSVSKTESETPPSSHAFSDCSIMLDSSFAELLRGEVDFIDVVLQSGKNVKHTMEYCDISCPIEMGKNLLKWGHLHPTYCDTNSVLADNLFTLRGAAPHVMVIGNLSEFKTIEYDGTKIIGVPSFQKTKTVVVLTKNFNVIPLSFKLI